MPSATLIGDDVDHVTPPGDDDEDDVDRVAPAAEERAANVDPATAPADDSEPVPMSLDRDASDRTFDRQLAHLGLLDDAAPLFREGSSVPGVGALLALPCVIESGLFWISRKLYGEIGPAFYGLRTTLGRSCSWRCSASSGPSISRNETWPHSADSLGSTERRK